MNPGDQGNDPMGADPWASVNQFFNLEQTPDTSFIDWNSVMLEPEPASAASLPATGQNSAHSQNQLPPQIQGQPGLHPQMHHPVLYQQHISQQPQQSPLPQSWQHPQGRTTPQSHIMQDPMQNYQLLSQYHVSEPNQYQLPYDAQSQQPVTPAPAPQQPQSQLQEQATSYHEFSLEPTPVPSQPHLQPQQQQSHGQQIFQSVQIPIDSQKQPALQQQQQQPARNESLQTQHTPIDTPRALQQLAPAPIRNPMSHHGSQFMTPQSERTQHPSTPSFAQQHEQPSHQPQQPPVQQGQQRNPYHNTINPQYLAPSQTYGHAHDPFIMVNSVGMNPSHHPINTQSSAIPATLGTSQVQIDQRYTQPQGHTTQAPSQQPQTTAQLNNRRPNMVWGSPSHPGHGPLQSYSMVQQLQPYGGVQHQMHPLIAPQPKIQKPVQGQAQVQVDSAPPTQQYQKIQPQQQPPPQQQQQGAQFHNLTAATNPQKQGQSTPSTANFQVQIPVKSVKPPKSGTVINLDSLKMPVRRKKKATTATTTAAKSKQVQPRKSLSGAVPGSTITLDGSSSSASSSDYSSESEADKFITPEPSPIPPTRPADPKGASRYDAIKAVWAPRNRRTTASTVRNALMTFSDLVKGMRDSWKSKAEALKEAESKTDEARKKELRNQVDEAKEVFDIAVKTAMEWGHPAVIQRLGEHPIVMASLYSFLLDRHSANDNDGSLTIDILKFMSLFTTMDQAMLEKTKTSKILPRLVKKGGEVTKKLAQEILANVAAETKRKAERKDGTKSSKPVSAASSTTSSTVSATKPSTRIIQSVANGTAAQAMRQAPYTGTKREREGDALSMPSAKRSAPSVSLKRSKPPVSTSQRASKPYTGTAGITTAINPPNPKPSNSTTVHKPAAPTSIFSSLMSASKKPGTSNAARAAAAAAAKDKGETKKPTSGPKPPAFSFSETMADLTKPKEVTPAARENKSSANESEEDRAARVKKEKKRKLRVQFKPEADLVEVRYFTHDPEEEVRADPSMIKDVDDVGGEGRMLKLHLGDDDLDEEEEVAEMKEEDIRPWPSLTVIDFSVLSEKERSENFIKFGGSQVPKSAEKLAQEQREANSLPPLRTSLADIPETPKEPPKEEESDKDQAEPTLFGEPNELVKARSDQYFESRSPQSATQPATESPPTGPAASNTAPTNNLSSLLNLFQNGAQQTSSPAAQSNPLADLEKTFSQFRAPAAVPTAPAASLQPQAPAPAFNGLDINKLLAVISASQQMGAGAPAMQPQQPAVPTPDASTILSQLSGVSGLGQAPPSMPAAGIGYGAAAQAQNQIYENEDRKRMREKGFTGHEGQSKRPKNGSEGKKRAKGSVICRSWKEGNCLKGDDCTFRHG